MKPFLSTIRTGFLSSRTPSNTKNFSVFSASLISDTFAPKSSTASSFASASSHSFRRSVVLTSVDPVAIAVTLPVWLSISICTSTVSGEAPELTAASAASFGWEYGFCPSIAAASRSRPMSRAARRRWHGSGGSPRCVCRKTVRNSAGSA